MYNIYVSNDLPNSYSAVQISQYVVHILRWFRVFPRDQIHIVDGDMLILNPYPEIRKVSYFIDVSSSFL